KQKLQIQQRFGTEESFLHQLPLPDRLSGVVHMATGTGKSYVIFAIAWLSLVMGLAKRVLVLGPASTIIEQGLREKFKELINKREFNSKLPQRYRGKAINLLTDNDPIEDDSIVIENINSVYTFGGITDTLFKNIDEVLVLGDEIHHAYSHLKYADNSLVLDREAGQEGRGETRDERLWMKFLRENTKITRHIGFTGTPYNQNEYFADIIFNYSIKDATEQKYIKKINSIIRTKTNEGDDRLTVDQRFEMVLKNHLENSEKYAYKNTSGERRVKPITIFICPNIKNAQRRYDEFVTFLSGYEKKYHGAQGTNSEIMEMQRKKVICVISKVSKSEYKQELDNIEETDPKKIGGSVEFIFAVNKLSEGWDVDNVFQIVPMEEKVFNSKLLISQVLGRGMRIPRKVPNAHIQQNYPVLTVTNHDKFADHIRELVDSVTESDMYLTSLPLTDREQGRGTHNFTLFNLNYIPNIRFEKADRVDQGPPGKLALTPFEEKLGVKVIRTKDEKRYELARNFYTIDQIVYDIFNRFKYRTFEALHFDFGSVVVDGHYPEEDEIMQVILDAMKQAGIKGDKLSEDNRKQIDNYFNQFLPRGKKKRVFENISGDLIPVDTAEKMDRTGIRVSELERDRTAFLSEDYETEVGEANKFVLEYINELRGRPEDKQQLALFKPEDFVERKDEIIRTFVKADTRPPYVVNTSKLKSPQNIVLVSHSPEKEFVFQLIDNSDYIDSWVKSPKDRVRRSFNPDFFIKIDLDEYISRLESKGKQNYLENLKKLQDEGIETIIKVVEIKSDEERDEATPKKEEYAKAHFEQVNEKLSTLNLADLESKYRSDAKQYYTFDLLTPHHFPGWIADLKKRNNFPK
ncbi:MAG: DEAD/DEAH box helicase family protein, partial [Deltaproteobacteria bacterium]|nr:DEAD/DEAH box helicase family protein [Deltaproteobacteria bacterium]